MWNYKNIPVKKETYALVLRHKKYPEESLDKAINRILQGDLKEYPQEDEKPEPRP